MYGKEILIDLENADVSRFNRADLSIYFDTLCFEILYVQPCDRHFWDDEGIPLEEQQTNPKTKGTTAIQFLLASNITIHTLDFRKEVFINIFVCKDFNTNEVVTYTKKFFRTENAKITIVER